ncbi:MAG: alpha/beta fold hydrolase [Pseudomonadota bacterium]|nr:alpha/beta fold hydrolase [Pseudomonadota bacterium]MEE3288395.1 alpha/beta fold hydrolase [Pseudomonadota bacterium]
MKTVLFALLSGIALYAVLVMVLFATQRSLLYLPSREKPDLSTHEGTGLQEIGLQTEDALVLKSWFAQPSQNRDGLTVLLLHGNAGHIGHRVDKFRRILDAGYGFLLLEYRGYGGNPGKPTEAGLRLDAQSALQFLVEHGIPHDNVILYGESLGSGIAVRLAAEHHFAAVILEAPYTSIADVAQRHYRFLPARWLVRDRYETHPYLGKIRSPVMVIHGESDSIIDISFGKRVFGALPEPKSAWFVPNAGHNDLPLFGLQTQVLDYLARIRDDSQ